MSAITTLIFYALIKRFNRYGGRDVNVSNAIKGSMRGMGVTREVMCRALGISDRTLTRKMQDPDRFTAGEIKVMRRLISDEVCDAMTRR